MLGHLVEHTSLVASVLFVTFSVVPFACKLLYVENFGWAFPATYICNCYSVCFFITLLNSNCSNWRETDSLRTITLVIINVLHMIVTGVAKCSFKIHTFLFILLFAFILDDISNVWILESRLFLIFLWLCVKEYGTH